jgi:hypothetical protein
MPRSSAAVIQHTGFGSGWTPGCRPPSGPDVVGAVPRGVGRAWPPRSRLTSPRARVGLVRDHDEEEARRTQRGQRLRHARQDLELVERARGRRSSPAHHDRIEDAIAIQEDGPRFSVRRRH